MNIQNFGKDEVLKNDNTFEISDLKANLSEGITPDKFNPYNTPISKYIRPVNLGRDEGELETLDYSVPFTSIFDRRRDGTYTPRFENYIGAEGNEDRLAKEQGAWEKLGTGLTRFATKAGLYATQATLGTAAGIMNAIETGTMSGLWDSDFQNTLDELDKDLDYALPIHYTDEYKSQNFLENMFYNPSTFFFKDVADGLAFVAGALIPEAALSAATGGSSLALTGARLGAKSALKGMAKGGLKGAAKSISHAHKISKRARGMSHLRMANRVNLGKNVGEVMRTTGFLARTSNFEAGMEARHNFHDALDQYYSSYYEMNGELPSNEEAREFIDSAKSAGNGVYWSNMAILSVSNLAMFGAKFGIANNTRRQINNFGNKFIGLSPKKLKGGKLDVQKVGKLGALGGNAYKILSKPAVEGLFEEGLQGVAGETMQGYMKSKYDPEYDQANALTASLADAFAQTYGTKEGWKEIGIGMIIGSLGGTLQGSGPAGTFSDSYSRARKNLKEQVDVVNKGIESYGTMVQKRMNSANSAKVYQDNLLKNKEESDENGTIPDRTEIDDILMAKQFIDSQIGLKSMDDIVADYEAMIDATELSEDVKSEVGEESEYKEKMKSDFRRTADSYKASKQIVNNLGLGSKVKTDLNNGSVIEVGDYLVATMMMGDGAAQAAENIGMDIEEMVGEDGIADAMKFYSDLKSKKIDILDERLDKQDELESKKEEFVQSGRRLSNLSSTVLEGTTDKQATNLQNQAAERHEILRQEIVGLEEDINKIDAALEDEFQGSKFTLPGSDYQINVDTIIEKFEKLRQVEKYAKALRDNGRDSDANTLEYLISEYKKFNDVNREMNNMFSAMGDSNFFSTKRGKGLIGSILGTRYEMSDEFKQLIRDNNEVIDRSLGRVKARGKKSVEDYLKTFLEENEELSDREKFKLEAIIRMQLNVSNRVQEAQENYASEEEAVSEKVSSPNDPLGGDSIRSIIRKIVKDNDKNSVDRLDKLILAMMETIDEKRGKARKDQLEALRKELKELREKMANTKGSTEETSNNEYNGITDEEYNNFLDNGVVPSNVIRGIALKISRGESLTEKENSVFTDKTSEINNELENIKSEQDTYLETFVEENKDILDEAVEEYNSTLEDRQESDALFNKIFETEEELAQVGDEIDNVREDLNKINTAINRLIRSMKSGDKIDKALANLRKIGSEYFSSKSKMKTKRGQALQDRVKHLQGLLKSEFKDVNELTTAASEVKEQLDQLNEYKKDLEKKLGFYKDYYNREGDVSQKSVRDYIAKQESKLGTINSLIDKLRKTLLNTVQYLDEYFKIWKRFDSKHKNVLGSIGNEVLTTQELTKLLNSENQDDVRRAEEYIDKREQLKKIEDEYEGYIDSVEVLEGARADQDQRLKSLINASVKYQDRIRYLNELITGETSEEASSENPLHEQPKSVFDIVKRKFEEREKAESEMSKDTESRISEIEKQIEELTYPRYINSDDYKRLKELNDKSVNEELTDEEFMELDALNSNIDEWIAATGTVVEGLRLSELIRLRSEIANAEILDVEDVSEVTPQDKLEGVFKEVGDRTNYDIGQSPSIVTASGLSKGGKKYVSVQGISKKDLDSELPDDFELQESTEEFPEQEERGNVVLSQEEVDRINNNETGVMIMPPSENLTTNYGVVLKETSKGNYTIMKSSHVSDYNDTMTPDAIYDLDGGEEVTLSVDPQDQHNVKLLDDLREAETEEEVSQAKDALRKGLVIRVVVNGKFIAVLKGKRDNDVKNLNTDQRFDAMRDELIDNEGFLQSLVDNEVYTGSTVVDTNGPYKRDSEGSYNKEVGNFTIKVSKVKSKKWTAVITDPNGVVQEFSGTTRKGVYASVNMWLSDNTSQQNKEEVFPVSTNITVKKTFAGQPNFNVTRNSDGTVSIVNKDFNEVDAKKPVDIGYMENGKKFTRTRKKGDETIDTTFLKAFEKREGKVPFVVLTVSGKRIAYPVKMKGNTKPDNSPMRTLFESDVVYIEKIIGLNRMLAERGVDIKDSGNTFTTENINDSQFFNDKFAQVESITYFYDLNEWVNGNRPINDLLQEQAQIDINVSSPFEGPKVAFDLSKIDVDISSYVKAQANKNLSPAPKQTEEVEEEKENCDS